MVAPIFRPEVINKTRARVLGNQQRRNPTFLTNSGRTTTGPTVNATTNPNGSTTQQTGSPIARGVGSALQMTADGLNAFDSMTADLNRVPAPATRIGRAAPGANGAGISGRPFLPGGLGWGGMMSRAGVTQQQQPEPRSFVNAGDPQYQGNAFEMGGNFVNAGSPQYQGTPAFNENYAASLGMHSPGSANYGMFSAGSPGNPLGSMADYRQITENTRRAAEGVDAMVAASQAAFPPSDAGFVNRRRDPQVVAMEGQIENGRRVGEFTRDAILPGTSLDAAANARSIPSDIMNRQTAGTGNRYDGIVAADQDPNRTTPEDKLRTASQSAESQTADRVREGNDAFGDRFRGGALNDYVTTGMTWQEREQAQRDAADQPNRDRAQKVMLERRAEREAARAADPEADLNRRLAIAQASADREERHNQFKEATGGLNYRQFDRLTKKQDSIERKFEKGLITRDEADRQIKNSTLVSARRASGESTVARDRLNKMPGGSDYEPTVDRTRLPNGELPQATRDRAAATAKRLVDPTYTGGSEKFKQSKETLANVGVTADDSAASASQKMASTPFPLEDPEAAMRTAMAYRMYWGSNKDAVKDWNTDDMWGALGFSSGKVDPQFSKMMDELTTTPVKDIQKWIDKYSGHLAMFGEDKSKYEWKPSPAPVMPGQTMLPSTDQQAPMFGGFQGWAIPYGR